MAQIEVKVPQLSESVAEATLLQWHKKVGDAVARDENLVDIETDKVVLELPAPSAGAGGVSGVSAASPSMDQGCTGPCGRSSSGPSCLAPLTSTQPVP